MRKSLKYTLWFISVVAVLALAMVTGAAGSLMYMKWMSPEPVAEETSVMSEAPLPPATSTEDTVVYAPEAEPSVEPVVEPEPVAEPMIETYEEIAVEPVTEPEYAVEPEPVTESEPAVEPVVGPEPVAQPQPVVDPEPVLEPEPVVEDAPASEPVAETAPAPTPLIAVVIDDMGVNQRRTKDMLQLEGALTSSFLTYGANLQKLAHQAQNAGHEVILHAAMEPKGPASLAPDTIKTSMDEAQIEGLFQSMLDKFDGLNIKGVNHHMGSKFTEDAEKLRYVMDMIKARDMYFMDSKTTWHSQGSAVAAADGVPYVARDVFLDNEDNADYIRKQFSELEKIAHQKGYAVAICHPKKQTYAVLKEWLEELPQKDVKLVHLGEIITLANAAK